jgi:nucleotide-binding universal stress UspA family protein
MEHGGSENPVIEGRLGAQLRDDQDTWYRSEREAECRVLTKAQATLEKAGFDTSRVSLKFGHEEDVARNILEEAAAGKYETIVMGRHGASGIKHIFGGGVTDQVLRDAKDFAIWVV